MKQEKHQTPESGASFVREGNVLVIFLNDDLDHHNALYIKERADRLLEKENLRHIVFDFTGVDFMDSSGIGVIMGRYKQVIFAGGKAAVCSIGAAVDRIFRLSGIYKIIEKYDSVSDAVAALGAGKK